MKKIVLLPMDERPCNYKFPKRLFENEEIQIIEPQTLGFKKMVQIITSLKISYVKNVRMPMV